MKLAISNIAWSENHEFYYQLMCNNGFSGLEIAPTKFDQDPYNKLNLALDIKKNLLDRYNLPIISMQSLLFGTEGLMLFHNQESRANLKTYLKKAIIYAKTINCPVLVFGNPKNRIMEKPSSDYAIAVDFFKELGDFAEQYNTCLCIEPNPKEYGTNFINTVLEANQLVDDVKSSGFGMIIDTGTMIMNNDQPRLVLEVLANTKHIHISMPFLKPLNWQVSSYEIWFKQFLVFIKNSVYNKFVSIEMVNACPEDINKIIQDFGICVRDL